MRVLTQLFAAVVFLAGITLFVIAFTTPGKYYLTIASADQRTQVYSEAIMYGVLSIAAFCCAIVLTVASSQRNS